MQWYINVDHVLVHVYVFHRTGGMLPMSSGRASLMSTGQGLVAPKPRPSTLSSAIGRSVHTRSHTLH